MPLVGQVPAFGASEGESGLKLVLNHGGTY